MTPIITVHDYDCTYQTVLEWNSLGWREIFFPDLRKYFLLTAGKAFRNDHDLTELC